MSGPLAGLRFVELVGIGPGPFAATLLSDLGAEVIRIDRIAPADIGIARPPAFDFAARGRASVALDLKSPEAAALVLDLVAGADAVVIVTEWPQIAECDWPKLRDTMANPVVIDGRNLLDPEFMAVAGFTYEGIGRMVETVGGELVEPASATDDELEAARTRRFTRTNGNGNGSVNGAAASTAIAASLMRRK